LIFLFLVSLAAILVLVGLQIFPPQHGHASTAWDLASDSSRLLAILIVGIIFLLSSVLVQYFFGEDSKRIKDKLKVMQLMQDGLIAVDGPILDAIEDPTEENLLHD